MKKVIEIPEVKAFPGDVYPRLFEIKDFDKYDLGASSAAIRGMIRLDKDGFKVCLVKRGGRVLIHCERYYRWLAEQNGETLEQFCGIATRGLYNAF